MTVGGAAGQKIYDDGWDAAYNFGQAISPTLGTTPDPLVKTINYVDPLILDLDGDGLEITPLSAGILFDANDDAIKTGTAWAGADDGMLVRDLDGNGQIDSGQELFGDETLLANGQKAANGFAALAELDSNADGQFDASDAQYANLRIWRDLNQDGISQADELQGLTASGVQSINLTSTASNTNYGDAILAQSGSFTRTDDSTGQAGSFILAQNNFTTSFEPIAVSEAARALPNLGGSGWVRNLHEAATESPELIALVNQAKDAYTRTDFKDAVADLMREWGNDSAYSSASKQALAAGYGLIMSDPADAQEAGWMDTAIKASAADRDAYRATLSETDRAKFDAMRQRMVGELENIHAYEAFTGYTFLNWAQVQGDAFYYTPRSVGSGGRVAVEVWVPLSQLIYENRNAVISSQAGYIRVTIPTPPSGMAHVETLWNRLVDDATTNLLLPLRLSKYFDLVEMNITDAGVSFDVSRLNASFATAATDPTAALNAVADLIDLQKYAGETVRAVGWRPYQMLLDMLKTTSLTTDIQNLLTAERIVSLEASGTTYIVANSAGWTVLGNEGANTLTGGAGNDVLYGGDGNDTITDGDGSDTIDGGAGDDVITDTRWGTNVLRGGDGNDTVTYSYYASNTVEGGTGNDLIKTDYQGGGSGYANTFTGGAGNDRIQSGTSADTYLFDRGDGQDTINDYGGADKLVFGAGIAASDITLSRSGAHLVIKVNDPSNAAATDQITIENWDSSNYRIEQAQFADGTVWDATLIAAAVLTDLVGTSSAETLTGTANADNIIALDGNDVLNGLDGNDRLAGGAGADTLIGGLGNDTYKLGRGDGMDTIQENDATASNSDVAQFDTGIAVDQLWFRQVSDNLEVSIIGTSDAFTISNWYLGNQYQVEQFKTSDGKTLLDSQVQNLVDAMAAFAPPAAGQTTLSASYTAALSPVIAANWQ